MIDEKVRDEVNCDIGIGIRSIPGDMVFMSLGNLRHTLL